MKNTILILSVLLGMCSCNDFLTIRPKSDITEKELLSTPEGIEDALYGVYGKLGEKSLYGGAMTWQIPDMLAQYYEFGYEFSNWSALVNFEKDTEYPMQYYAGIWTNMYQAIGYVNNVVNSLLKQDESSMKYYSIYLGEALGLRAFMHFDLVRSYAPHVTRKPDEQGIPYVLKWTPLVTPFSSVGKVYANVISELKESERLLIRGMEKMDEGNAFTQTPQIHFNLYAAQATLARVYWMMGDLDSARIYALKVIESQKFELCSGEEVRDLVASVVANKEAIWGVYNKSLMDEFRGFFYESTTGYLIKPNSNFSDLYVNDGPVDNERRLGWFREKNGNAKDGVLFMKLFNEAIMTGKAFEYKGIPGVNLIRLPEMYLIVAESLLEKDPALATEYYDRFIVTRGLQAFKEKSKTVTLEDINKERRKEFIGEGQEIYNMKRQLREVTTPKGTLEGTDELYQFVIPVDEFDYRYMDEEVVE